MENILFTGIIGLALGIFIAYYDKKSGSKLYKKWYNVSNKNKIDPNLEIGFITNQLFGQKLTIALVLTALAYIVHFFIIGEPFLALFRMIGFFVGIMIAFYASGILFSLFSKKVSSTIDYIEKVEKGNLDIREDAKEKYEKVKEKVKESITKRQDVVAEGNSEPATEPTKKAEPKENSNWRDGVKNFMDK